MNKFNLKLSNSFKKSLKIVRKRKLDLNKLYIIVKKLVDNEQLDDKYRDHQLTNSKHFINCRECHIEPDWLLIYKKNDSELVLLLIETGSHSDLFNK